MTCNISSIYTVQIFLYWWLFLWNIHTFLYSNTHPGSLTKLQHTPESALTCQDPEENSQCPHFNYNISQTGAGSMEVIVRISVQHREATAPQHEYSSSCLFRSCTGALWIYLMEYLHLLQPFLEKEMSFLIRNRENGSGSSFCLFVFIF